MPCKGEFWIQELSELVCDWEFIPLPSMKLSEQMNALTRFFILLGIILIFFLGLWPSLVVMLSGILLSTILFNSLRKMKCTENYESQQLRQHKDPPSSSIKPDNYRAEFYDLPRCKNSNTRICSKNISNPHRTASIYQEIIPGPDFFSVNQQMAGNPAKRTMVPPVLVPPPFSSEWKENSLVVRPGINSQTNQDLSRSGYLVSEDTHDCSDNIGQVWCCGDKDMNRELLRDTFTPGKDIVEDYCSSCVSPSNKTNIPPINVSSENPVSPLTRLPVGQDVYNFPYERKEENKSDYHINDSYFSGDVLMSDGYFPKQIIDNNLPSNVAFGECAKDPVFDEYNEQLYTSTIEPGIYSRNQIVEPISSNIGISFTQQFEPTTCTKDKSGMTFIGHDPNVVELPEEKSEQLIPYDRQTHLADIYDPRFTGYGTSYRSYIEPVTGQARFYYDDVDAYKRPNMLCRSKVDHIPSSVSTQAMPSSEYFEKQNRYARTIANQKFADDTMNFRTDLQQRLMRKANANLEQTRRFPKHTRSFNRGSMCNPRAR